MNKSILVIDTPKSCKTCPIFNRYFHECPLVKRGLYDEERKGIRHENCPLKPLPQKRELPKLYEDNYELKAEIKGFNACLEQILGEE